MLILCGLLSHQIVGKVCICYLFLCSIFLLCNISFVWEHNEAVHQLFVDFKKAYYSFRREALYNILIEFGIPKKLVSLMKMCLYETCSRNRVGKNLSEMFPFTNVLKKENALSPLLWNMPLGGFR